MNAKEMFEQIYKQAFQEGNHEICLEAAGATASIEADEKEALAKKEELES